MHIKKELIIFAFSFAIMLNLFPIANVQAEVTNDNVNIISESKVTAEQAENWAKSKGATETFIELADLYFKYYREHGNVNPAIAYVQAAKETGYGKFGGVLDESYNNPCGLKTAAGGLDTDKDAHKKFNNWDQGVQAHLDHLALYAGANGYPRNNSYDERQFKTIKATAFTVNSLGGKWAPSSTYGEEVNNLYKELLSFSEVKIDKDAAENQNITKNNNISASNPGTPEIKPSALNVSKVIDVSNSGVLDNTPNITSSIGWKNKNGKWYYYKSDNTKVTGWIKPDNNWYYLKNDATMATGWLKDNETWYYLNDSGVMTKGWIKLNNDWYFLQGDGSMVTGLKNIENKIYLFSDSGSMKIGWQEIAKNRYYFNSDGSMATGWLSYSGSNYYLYDTGAMAKGWINLDGTWYYLKENGTMVTGWVTSNNASYYLDASTGRMLINTIVDGYKIGFDGKRQTSSSQNDRDIDKQETNNKSSNGKKIIAIDAGHDYSKDGGAISTINGVKYSEVDLNIEVAAKLQEELEERGYTVIMTREEDEKPSYGSLIESLSHKADVANDASADFFISIHHNSVENAPTVSGVETYYSVAAEDEYYGGNIDEERIEKSKEIAIDLEKSIVNKIGAKSRGARTDISRGSTLFVLRNTKMPAVLVETGFITNEEEAERCADSDDQQKIAEAMADVISKYF